jgi:hypothetical protein
VTSLKSFCHLLKSSELILSKILALVIPSKIIAFVVVKDLKDDFIFLGTIFHLRSQLLGLLGQEISIEFCLVILNLLNLLVWESEITPATTTYRFILPPEMAHLANTTTVQTGIPATTLAPINTQRTPVTNPLLPPGYQALNPALNVPHSTPP